VSGPEMFPLLAKHAPSHASTSHANPLHLSERQCDIVEVAAFRDQTEQVRAQLPRECLHIAPNRWLVAASRSTPGALAANLASNLGTIAAIADQSGGTHVLRLRGVHVRDALAKICRLDLAPEAFAVGNCARTIMAQIPVLVSRPELVSTFDLFVPVTLAHAFVEHLLRTAAEYGIVIEASNQD
jgi:heterotetrameric sarcosine oxidase gamma subunit